MGYSPQQINAMSIWQFMAVLDGYIRHNEPDDGKLSGGEIDDVWKWMQEKEGA